jgi:hypothetical protein
MVGAGNATSIRVFAGNAGSVRNGRDNLRWRCDLATLAGFGDTSMRTGLADDPINACSPHMHVFLLRLRVSKKLLLWSLLLASIPMLREAFSPMP